MSAPELASNFSHEDVQKLLLAGEPLSASQQATLQQHLTGCAKCRRFAAFVTQLPQELQRAVPPKELTSLEKRRVTRQITDQIQSRKRPRPGPARSSLRSGLQTLGWAAMAVILVLGLQWVLRSLLPQPANPATPSVTSDQATPSAPANTGTDFPKWGTPLPPTAPGVDYGYLNRAGFVDRAGLKVLSVPVAQYNGEAGVILVQAVANPERTEIWMDFQGTHQTLNGAKLELPDGTLLDHEAWDWPNSLDPSLLQGYLRFPGLPADVNTVTLQLPDGYRLPVQLSAAEQSGVAPVGLASIPCIDQNEVRLCIRAAAQANGGSQVLLEVQPFDPTWQVLAPMAHANPYLANVEPRLVRPDGSELAWQYPSQNPTLLPEAYPAAPGPLAEGIRFELLPEGSGPVTLRIPDVTVQIPLQAVLAIDVGGDPQPGSSWTIDQSLQVAGQTVHFTQAILGDDGMGGVELELLSEPVEMQNNRLVHMLEIGRPEGLEGNFGYGFDPQSRRHSLRAGLTTPDGSVHRGLLQVPVVNAQVVLFGPYEISWEMPPALPPPAATLAVIGPESFSPPPIATPIPMEGVVYTGIPLESGQVLVSVHEAGNTRLFTAGPVDGYTPQELGSLPGLVFHIAVHPDRQGIDFFVGASRTEFEANAILDAQLYTWRFGQTPQWLAGPVPILDIAHWSAQGRYLLFSERKAAHESWAPRLLDMDACRADPPGCAGRALQLSWRQGDANLNCPVWSPTEPRLALCGFADGANGFGDVYISDFSAGPTMDGTFPNLTNLSNSPSAEGMGAIWLPDGSGVLYICEPPNTINVFNLCRQSLGSNPVNTALSFSQSPGILAVAPDNSRIAFIRPIFKGETVEIMLGNLQTGEIAPLVTTSWLSGMSFSPDGQTLLYTSASQGQAVVVNLVSATQASLAERLGLPAAWAGWVP